MPTLEWPRPLPQYAVAVGVLNPSLPVALRKSSVNQQSGQIGGTNPLR